MTMEHPSTGVISPPTEYDHASRGNDNCVTSSGITGGFVKRRVDGGVVRGDIERLADKLEFVAVSIQWRR